MLLLRKAILWVWLAAAGPDWFLSKAASYQVQVRIPVWDVGGLISRFAGYVKEQDSSQKKKERPHNEGNWPHPYAYDPYQQLYPQLYYPYPPIPPPWPNEPPTWPTNRPTRPTKPTTEQPTQPTTQPPTLTTLPPTTEPPTETPTTQSPTESPTTQPTTESPTDSTTDSETDTTDDPTRNSPTKRPVRPNCKAYPHLPGCRNTKPVDLMSNMFGAPDQKLSVDTVPHSVTSLCFYYPRLCMKPEEAQFVRLTDANGKPFLMISSVEGKSPPSLG
ncbi:hypothetical protein KR009_011896 [Drosophila setifemur]|nr:hypothetical protein KR009_011896 [Drosophila setifemur]